MSTLLLAPILLLASHLFVLAAALLLGAGVQGGGALGGALAVILLLVPPVVVALLLPWRRWAVPAALGGWGLVLLVALPVMLPYPAARAVNAGLGIVGGGCAGVGELAYAVLPDLSGTGGAAGGGSGGPLVMAPDCPPSPAVTPAAATAAVAAVAWDGTAGDGDVVIPYQSEGSAIIIPVRFTGAGGRVQEYPMLFDTGATLTTLNRATLDELGLAIAPDAPIITSQTAGGERQSPITMTPGLEIGGRAVPDVTVSLCEPCADEKSRGLLGMNVSGRFLITIDTVAQQLILRPREGGQTRDVEPWLELSASALQSPGGPIEVEVSAKNRAARSVSSVKVRVRCGVDAIGEVRDIPAGGSGSSSLTLPAEARCDSYQLSLAEASW